MIETFSICAAILGAAFIVTRRVKKVSQQLDDLTNEVASIGASINNAVNLLGTIVAGGGDDPAKLVPLTEALTTAQAALDAAVAKWTPGPAPVPAPAPTPAPVPGPGVAAATPKVSAHLGTPPAPTPSPKIR